MKKMPNKLEHDVPAKTGAEAESETLAERKAWVEESGAPLADVQVLKIGYFNPAERAQAKRKSRERDEKDLESGKITREELQYINGGHGIFKKGKISHRPRFRGSCKLQRP